MKQRGKNKRVGIVYSTDPDYEYNYKDGDDIETPPKAEQRLRIKRDTRDRKGKVVTLIIGFQGSSEDKKDLCKLLKSRCGAGGSVVDEGILIQGDHRDKVFEILLKSGYRDSKKSGG